MRLTLRTMLAYMDDILEPDDATDIGKKLEESDLAKGIMHRLRDSIRRLRLGAPPPLGNGMGLDPNSVAEYLDNTLPAEQVGEFEKICLESDVHLAEVGACHQILTLVLGEPAEVDAAARERMYHIATRTASPQAVPTQLLSPVSSPGSVQVQPARRARPEVPDYLRESRSRSWVLPTAILALVLVCGGIAGVVFFHELRNLASGRAADVPNDNAPAGETLAANAGPPASETPEEDTAAVTGSDAEAAASGDSGANSGPLGGATADGLTDNSADGDAMPAGDDPIPDDLPEADVAAGAPAPDPNAVQPGMAAEGATPAPPAAAPPDPTPPGETLGRYSYKQDVLLRLDRGAQLWRRLPATNLAAGDRLMTLAAFRPAIKLLTDITIQPVDASRFELLGLYEAGVPAISLEYGRFILFTTGKAQNSIQIRMGDHQAMLTFVDSESTLAIDVRRQWIPGRDPTVAAGPLVAHLFVMSGAVTWEEAGTRFEWKSPQHAVVDSRGVHVVDTELAKWTRGDSLSRVELGAAETVEHELTGDQPVSLSVKELLSARKSEVRDLGIRAAANVDEFEMLVKMLNDPDQKLLWQVEIEALRSAVARDPETAKLVQKAFESHRGADGSELFHMLWGYSTEDVAGGVMKKLVEYLNNDEWLDLRVLAYQNLHDITGKSLGYKPEASSRVRRPAYQQWKERLKELKAVPAGG